MIHFLMQAFIVLGAILALVIVGAVLLFVLWVVVEEVIELIKDYKTYQLEKYDEL